MNEKERAIPCGSQGAQPLQHSLQKQTPHTEATLQALKEILPTQSDQNEELQECHIPVALHGEVDSFRAYLENSMDVHEPEQNVFEVVLQGDEMVKTNFHFSIRGVDGVSFPLRSVGITALVIKHDHRGGSCVADGQQLGQLLNDFYKCRSQPDTQFVVVSITEPTALAGPNTYEAIVQCVSAGIQRAKETYKRCCASGSSIINSELVGGNAEAGDRVMLSARQRVRAIPPAPEVSSIFVVGRNSQDATQLLKRWTTLVDGNTGKFLFAPPPPSWLSLMRCLTDDPHANQVAIPLSQLQEMGEKNGVSNQNGDFNQWLLYMKLTGRVIFSEDIVISQTQYVFTRPYEMLKQLERLCGKPSLTGAALREYMGRCYEDVEIDECGAIMERMNVEGMLPKRFVLEQVKSRLNTADDSLAETIIEIGEGFGLIFISGRSVFFPSLISATEDVASIESLWPATLPDGTHQFQMLLQSPVMEFPNSFQCRLSVSISKFFKCSLRWETGCVAGGSKCDVLVRTKSSSLGTAVRFDLRCSDGRDAALEDMKALYWACIDTLSYFPGLPAALLSACKCGRYYHKVFECLGKPYRLLYKMACEFCPRAGNRLTAGDIFPCKLPERPGMPENLNLVKNDEDLSVQLQWKPPKEDGGLDIVKYIVMKKENEGQWEDVHHESLETSCIVGNLKTRVTYHFRVAADTGIFRSDFKHLFATS